MAGLDENFLKGLDSSQILKQEFLRCDSKEDVSEEQNMIQEIFLKKTLISASEPTYANQPIYINELLQTQTLYSESVDNIEAVYSEPFSEPAYVNNQPIYETIDELHTQSLYSNPSSEPTYANQPIYINELPQTQTLYNEAVDNIEAVYSEPFSEPAYVNNQPIYETLRFESDIIESQQKTESVISEKSLFTIEGKFKKKDTKNLQNIVDWTQSSDANNFGIYFKLILSDLKKLKSSSSKLAAFLYVLDSTKDLNQIDSKKLYKTLPKKYKKLIKKSNPKFSLDMHSPESLKSIDSIRAHLKERSIFIKAEPLPLKDRI